MLKPAVFSCCLMFFDLIGSLMFWDVKKWRVRRSALQNRFWWFLHKFLSCLMRAMPNSQQILESSGILDIVPLHSNSIHWSSIHFFHSAQSMEVQNPSRGTKENGGSSAARRIQFGNDIQQCKQRVLELFMPSTSWKYTKKLWKETRR